MYKIFIITNPSPPEHSSHTSPHATEILSVPRKTVFYAAKESAPICSGQRAFTKRPDNVAIGKYWCDTSIPSDTSQPFI